MNLEDVVGTLKESGCVGDEALKAVSEGIEGYKSVANSALSNANPGVSGSLEQNFTTNGTQGSLHCPFSNPNKTMSNNGMHDSSSKMHNGTVCGHEDLDPVKAELSDKPLSQTASAASSGGRCPVARCPIRYMNQHAPEEIAEFVERHKNEIPRSHAVCVQRYQKDAMSMRKLDAKYGGLISMVQGLGEKHQAFLPGQAPNGDRAASNSFGAVSPSDWTEDANARDSVQAGAPEKTDDAEEEHRESHFDRPLREIRVGESPSRPWGIHVPPNYQPSTSAPQSPRSPTAALPASAVAQQANNVEKTPIEGSTTKPARTGRCPFGYDAAQDDKKDKNPLEAEEAKATNIPKGPGDDAVPRDDNGNDNDNDHDKSSNANARSASADVVFNGPVFFGYTAEQTAAFLRALGHQL